MKTILFLAVAVAVAGFSFGAPVVTISSLTQDGESDLVVMTYSLADAPGVVTFDVQTNAAEGAWASIGADKLTTCWGDVNRLVTTGDVRTITWKPCRDWCGHRIDGDKVRAVLTAWATNAPPDYMVVDLSASNRPCYYVSADALPGGVTNDLYKTEKLVLRKIPAAGSTFRIGAPLGEKYRENDHREDPSIVNLTEDFYLGICELTQRQYALLNNASRTEDFNAGDKKPTNSLSWNLLCGWDWGFPTDKSPVAGSPLAALVDRTGVDSFTLPSAAQWEFACRAGSGATYYWGYDDSVFGEYGWSSENATEGEPQPCVHEVGLRKPNAYGLYDMLGNVEEICGDWYVATDGVERTDPEGPAAGEKRIAKGGSYQRPATTCRCAFPTMRTPGDYTAGQGARLKCAAFAY